MREELLNAERKAQDLKREFQNYKMQSEMTLQSLKNALESLQGHLNEMEQTVEDTLKQKEEDIKSLTEDLPRPLVALLQLARRRDEQYLGTYIVLIVGLLLSIDITDHHADDRVKQIDDAIQDLCARGSATCTRYCNGCTVPGNFRLQNVRKAIRKHGSFLAHVNLSGNIWNAPRSALNRPF